MHIEHHNMFIAGEFTNGKSQTGFADINPTDGKCLCDIPAASQQDIDATVAVARRAQAEWAQYTGAERGRILRRAADILRERKMEIARLESLDTGRAIQETPEADIESAAECLDFFGGIAAAIQGEHTDLARAFFYTRREPLGVCAGIGAWNYPIQIACWKAAPCLATGNAMIFKPAELTPLSALELARAFKDAGLPNGLFNVVQGDADVGRMLTTHPEIAKVSMTGEASTGKKIMADAASTLKEVTFELGGKSPLIVFDDADIDEAVSGAMMGNFYSQGEICTNGTRVFVHENIKDAFLERLLARTAKLKLGDPLDETTQVGPLISHAHLQVVLNYIEAGKSENATVLCGGERATDGVLAQGAFVQPTIFNNCTDDMRIVQEEIFGPVVSVLSFQNEDEVIRRANNTHYGLAGAVFTRDLARAHRVSAQLEAGVIWVNTINVTPIEMPLGGFKSSGLGRENGWAVIDAYTQRKSVYVELQGIDCPYE